MDYLNQITPYQLSLSTLRKRIRLIIYIVITILSAGQIYSISIDYLSGEITTKVNLVSPERFALPTVSLCFPFLDLINLTKADHRFGNFSYFIKKRPFFDDYENHNDIYTEIYSMLGKLTIKELNGLLKDIEQVAPIVKLTPITRNYDTIEDQLVNANASCKITHYICQPSFCLTIICLNETNQPLEYRREDILKQPNDGAILYIRLKPNISIMASSVGIVFTSSNDLIHRKKQSGFRIGFNEGSPATHVITYGKIVNFLIQESYEISCFNYSLIGYSSQAAYFDACLNNASSQETGSVFYGTLQRYNDNNDLMSGFHQFYLEYLNPNETERERKRNFYKYCREYCYNQAFKPDCREEIFYPVAFRKLPRSDGIHTIVVIAPTNPFEVNRYYHEYTLLDLLIYFASSLNFWFGLSIVSLSEQFLDFYCKLFTHKKDSKIPKSNSATKLSKVNSRPIEVSVIQTRRQRITKIINISNGMPDVYY